MLAKPLSGTGFTNALTGWVNRALICFFRNTETYLTNQNDSPSPTTDKEGESRVFKVFKDVQQIYQPNTTNKWILFRSSWNQEV